MVYLVAAVYGLIGRNMLAIQLMNSVIGAATAVVIYLCAHQVFQNSRVARIAGIAVAFYPSLVLWSAQGLKDGPTVFCLALAILCTLRLGEKLSLKYIFILSCALLALIALRFYVFYMIAVAIVGAFVIGMQQVTATSFARQLSAVVLLGLAMTYVGVTRSAGTQLERYGNLEVLQRSRADQARSAESGFGRDVDVSSTSGALSTIPTGSTLFALCAFPLAGHFFASKHHPAGDGYLVGFVSITGPGAVVQYQISLANDLTDFDFHSHADACLFGFSGQRGNSVPPAGAATGVLFHIRGCRGCARKGEARRTKAATGRGEKATEQPMISRRIPETDNAQV